jgi:hypothetical protein
MVPEFSKKNREVTKLDPTTLLEKIFWKNDDQFLAGAKKI